MLINGSCHCGNISFTLEWEPEPTEIPARACDCSFCTKHGGVWTSNPRGVLRVTVRDPAQRRPYQFGTRTADFHICTRCGVVPVVTSYIEGQRLRRRARISAAARASELRRRGHRRSPGAKKEKLDSRR